MACRGRVSRNIASEGRRASAYARLILRRIGYWVPGASCMGAGARPGLAFASTTGLALEPPAVRVDALRDATAASGASVPGSGFMMLTAGIEADDGKK